MSTICAGVGGRLIELDSGNAIAPLTIDAGGIDIEEFGVMIGIEMRQEVQAQFQPSLDDAIYVTPFGDSPGVIALTYIANNDCEEDGDDALANKFLSSYVDDRLRPNKDPAVEVTVGGQTFRGFVTGMQFNGTTSDTPIIQGTLILTAWSTT